MQKSQNSRGVKAHGLFFQQKKKKNYEQKISFGPPLKFFPRLETWAKPPLKSMVLTVFQNFVVLYNNYLFAAKFLLLITIIFLSYLIRVWVWVPLPTATSPTDDLTDKKFSQNKL